jgi:ATP-binding cassette subfamily C protein
MSGQGPVALFDLPWLPIYLIICYLLHPWIGLAALLGAILLVALTVLTEVVTRAPMRAAVSHANLRNNLAEASRRNSEALVAMGMMPRLQERWRETNRDYMTSSQQAADRAGGFGAAARTLRLMLQSGVLALGPILSFLERRRPG